MRPRGGFSHPERVVEELHIKKGGRVADFGAGSGYFTLELAQQVGPDGVVTAVDVLPTALEIIKSKAADRGLLNIVYIRANLESKDGSKLAESSQDMVLLANILFQSQKKEALHPILSLIWIPRLLLHPQARQASQAFAVP